VTGSRRWHLLGVALVGFGLLLAATAVDGWLPDAETDPAATPHVREVEVGERADLRTLEVRVDRVRGSRTLDEFGAELHSPGVWVLVEYTVVATRENERVGFAELRDDEDRVWSLVGRNDDTCLAGPPGVPVSCAAYFEVPLDALDGLRLLLARDFGEQRFDAMAEVDLALAGRADEFADAPTLEVPGSAIGGSS
jgi:hypothetical protein